ncbi:hypothetical protein GUITHDRAFT_63632 [Guillardia theta CCMP2712]|uniref:Uncharacterized protein n=1 Tax=Guillardia theta (strain CCMP2712) TaxID=905079 RepID=L1K0F9_GUITC|nr:hypothetical protein GUITHDRAFT_63632 [Guillardia theta CCMP2712]EKX54306.1 hypothetical protein GUITHDRAFT_63632 [Guillardia theta CCMP2712]|eukprot:XP_005841286.1 hypothetical protein GUITHDRAFT_63632 [Guillardia theta CCMP2712]
MQRVEDETETSLSSFFLYRSLRYFQIGGSSFLPACFNINAHLDYIRDTTSQGLTTGEVKKRKRIFGLNELHVPLKSSLSLLLDEVLNPFYVFQVFSIFIWLIDGYTYYACAIAIMSIVSAVSSTYTTRRNLMRIRRMAEVRQTVTVYRQLALRREENYVEVDVSDLVPGDILILNGSMAAPCDLLLVRGSCVVDESMLTGESVPILKSPPSCEELQEAERRKEDKLSCDKCLCASLVRGGTKITEVISAPGVQASAVVVRTGYLTAKGQLVRSILISGSAKMQFYRDSLLFVAGLAVVAVLGFFLSLSRMLTFGVTLQDLIIRACDIITITVPPALPAALVIGLEIAMVRLRAQQIFCSSPVRVNAAGQLDVVCFDKTGTLTEDRVHLLRSFSLAEILSSSSYSSSSPSCSLPSSPSSLSASRTPQDATPSLSSSQQDHNLLACMSCCHDLTRTAEGLVGDPLDEEVFARTGCKLELASRKAEEGKEGESETGEEQEHVDVVHFERAGLKLVDEEQGRQVEDVSAAVLLRRFRFTSELKRCSCVAELACSRAPVRWIFVKGAPEVIFQLCLPSSLPPSAFMLLRSLAEDGKRVIACAHRSMREDEATEGIERRQIERDLVFCGLLVFENPIKSDSLPSILQLQAANIRCSMVTGDHVLTALSAARACRMVEERRAVLVALAPDKEGGTRANEEGVEEEEEKEEEEQCKKGDVAVAMTGDTFDLLLLILLQDDLDSLPARILLSRAVVYARMSPLQKQKLIEFLKVQENLMVGFCGDGANDCGALKAAHVGLSLSPAEASAAAPFTSSCPSIRGMVTLVREGRAALACSVSCFKFMAMYSLIQSISVLWLYQTNSTLSDAQFLWIDMFLILPFTVSMPRTRARATLLPILVKTHLASLQVLLSMLGQCVLCVTFQVPSSLLHPSPLLHRPIRSDTKENILSEETSVTFLLSLFQYLAAALVFNLSNKLRMPLYSNITLMLNFLVALLSSLLILFALGKSM